MAGAADLVNPFAVGIRLRDPRDGRHIREDLDRWRLGMLDGRSFWAGYRRQSNPVELTTTSLVPDSVDVDPRRLATDSRLFTEPIFDEDKKVWRDLAFGRQRRVVREVRRQHNAQLRMGRDRMMIPVMYGDVGLAALTGQVIAYTGTTATTLTGASSLSTAAQTTGNTGLQGHVVFVPNATVANSVFGVVLSNTATAITVDQWYAIPVTGAAGTTPANSAGTAYLLPGGSGFFPWVALSTSVAAAAGTDVPRTADGLWGDGTTGGTATETTVSGLVRAYCGFGGTTAPVLTPGTTTSTIALAHTWTLGTNTSTTLGKVIYFNALQAAGNLAAFETLLNATGTVNLTGDTIAVTWTHTLTTI